MDTYLSIIIEWSKKIVPLCVKNVNNSLLLLLVKQGRKGRDVLVKVYAAAVNFIDIRRLKGTFMLYFLITIVSTKSICEFHCEKKFLYVGSLCSQ
jgi:hypothetical protein